MDRTLFIVKYLFASLGLIFICVGLWQYFETNALINRAYSTKGVVIDLIRGASSESSSGNYKPVVRFKTERGEEIEFVSGLGTSPPLFDRGEIVTIFYQPDSPENAKIDEFWSLWFFSVLSGGMGIISFSVGGGMILFSSLGKKREERLRREGTRIQAKFNGVELNRRLRVNNRSPYRITCQWQDPVSSKLHIFKSENLWFDPTDFVKTKTITVFIDMKNPKKYYVDVSFLPETVT